TVAPTRLPAHASTHTPSPTTKPALSPSASLRVNSVEGAAATTPSPEPDVLIQPRQFDQPISVQLGQTIIVVSPDPSAEWQVEFDPDLFEPQAPSEPGWRFKAVAAGQGLIVLTSVVNCGQPQPCPLMPRRMELTIEVKSP
ncbi:MAG: hypothetical protein AAB217_22855, partial [Chloroflexota bacterium]